MEHPDFERLESLSREEIIAELQERAGITTRALQIQRDPEKQVDYFYIDLTATACQLPPTLREQVDPNSRFIEAQITIEHGTKEQNSNAGFIFALSNSDTPAITVFLNPQKDSDYLATMIVGSEEPLELPELVSNAEVNRFIASLFIPTKSGDLSIFNKLDLTDPSIARNVSLALERNTNNIVSTGSFTLVMDGMEHTLEYSEENGELDSVIITHKHEGATDDEVMVIGINQTLDAETHKNIERYTRSPDGQSHEAEITTESQISFIDFIYELNLSLDLDNGQEELAVREGDIDTLSGDQRGDKDYREIARNVLNHTLEEPDTDSSEPS